MAELPAIQSSPLISASSKKEIETQLNTPERLTEFKPTLSAKTPSPSIYYSALVDGEMLPQNATPNIDKVKNELNQAVSTGKITTPDQAITLLLGAPLVDFITRG